MTPTILLCIVVTIFALIIFSLVYLLMRLVFRKKINTKIQKLIALIISVTLMFIFYKPAYYQFEIWAFTTKIKENKVYSILSEKEPVAYKSFMDTMRTYIINNKNYIDFRDYAGKFVNQLFYKYLQNANDQDIYNYVNQTLKFYQYVYTIDPTVVVKIDSGEDIPQNIYNDKNAKTYLNNISDAKYLIFKNSTGTTQNPPDNQAFAIAFTPIIQDLTNQYGQTTISYLLNGNIAGLDPKLASSLIISFYQELIQKGPQTAGLVMRTIAADIVHHHGNVSSLSLQMFSHYKI